MLDKVIHEPSRFKILAHLYVVESADEVFLLRNTGLTWGNLASHLRKLEEVGYVKVKKDFKGRKPHTMLRLTEKGRRAFDDYRKEMRKRLEKLD